MNIFQHGGKPAIIACRNCSALQAIIAHETTSLMWSTKVWLNRSLSLSYTQTHAARLDILMRTRDLIRRDTLYKHTCAQTHNRPSGVARNSFWVGIIFTARYYSPIYTSSLTTSAAISAQNNFQGRILEGYIYRYTPRRYAPE